MILSSTSNSIALLSVAAATKYACWTILVIAASFVIVPFGLATITLVRQQRRRTSHNNNNNNNNSNYRSALYTGRVWHTRYHPVKHAFSYPIFLFVLDLEDEVETEQIFEQELWPLSCIMRFRESDHLKNGEGRDVAAACTSDADDSLKPPPPPPQEGQQPQSLSQRIFRLVAQKIQQQKRQKQQQLPHKSQFSSTTHRVLLITHLSYYGYCFNPVSFYLLQNKQTGVTDAVVGEVSNTPWNEMYCYVLHPNSVDQVECCSIENSSSSADNNNNTINYVFPKSFHVSPFMEMTYKYDWTFDQKLLLSEDTNSNNSADLRIITDMRKISNNNNNSHNQLQFRARLQVHRRNLHPYCLAWHLMKYPFFCLLIQIWIHYEAFWLFLKGVAYQPHPAESETAASKIIGSLMTPLFALQEWSSSRWKRKQQ